MTRDLSRDLHDLAARTAASLPAGGLDVGTLTGRTRRRRRVRTAITGVCAAGVVAVLAGGAAFVGREQPAPVPADTPTVSPSPTLPAPSATPTVRAVALPPGDPSAPFGTCGALASTPPASGVAATWLTSAGVLAASVPAGEPLGVWGELVPPGDDASLQAVGYPAAGPRFAVLRDGVVVAGGTDLYGGARDDLDLHPVWFEGMGSPVYDGTVALTVCDPGDGSADVGASLPAGDYTLLAWTPVAGLGTTELPDAFWTGERTAEEIVAASGATWVAALAEPVPFSIVGTAEEAVSTDPGEVPSLDVPTSEQPPVCGVPAPAGPSSPLGFSLTTSTPTTTLAAGEEVAVTGVLTAGPGGRWSLGTPQLDLVVSTDGVVVGATLVPADGWMFLLDLGPGTPYDVGATSLLTTCSGGGGVPGTPLPPGTYTVHPVMHLSHPEVWTPAGGTQEGPQGWVDVVGEPFEVTVR
ncbi:hypothetical protein OMK64_18180 [Cellulomonas fimi]|uniref:hypothetical protein n=1 Tax=Cellulomonas fimi TaxID=1708 RepID=UPI00234E23E0|nr:hypothetical protein [Cellulomonas fimi]MDC7123463.1 hypothetical protein [Cellulomonas fimi]